MTLLGLQSFYLEQIGVAVQHLFQSHDVEQLVVECLIQCVVVGYERQFKQMNGRQQFVDGTELWLCVQIITLYLLCNIIHAEVCTFNVIFHFSHMLLDDFIDVFSGVGCALVH